MGQQTFSQTDIQFLNIDFKLNQNHVTIKTELVTDDFVSHTQHYEWINDLISNICKRQQTFFGWYQLSID